MTHIITSNVIKFIIEKPFNNKDLGSVIFVYLSLYGVKTHFRKLIQIAFLEEEIC